MARRPRNDSPDSWFHVMNRGIARRTMFERREDMDVFLEQLETARDRDQLEVHAYCLMATHYHLLVRSPAGDLASGMQRVQTEYSRWFNRSRRRDGPLVRGRYTAKEVDSLFYRRTVVRYIDRNAVRARLVPSAGDYPYGSAWAYSNSRSEATPWLERSWVEQEVCRVLEMETYDPGRYAEVFSVLPASLARIVGARLQSRVREDPLDDLVRASPDSVLAWMKRKAALADGTHPGLPLLAFEDVKRVLRSRSKSRDSHLKIGRQDGWHLICAGLARELCGLKLDEIAVRMKLSRSQAGKLTKQHRCLLLTDSEYAAHSAAVASRALEIWLSGGK